MFELEVTAGIAALAYEEIDWRPAVLAPGLHMSIPTDCVLGRTVQGGYFAAMPKWGVDEAWMERHGFFISDETLEHLYETLGMNIDQAYAELREAWQNAARDTPESIAVN